MCSGDGLHKKRMDSAEDVDVVHSEPSSCSRDKGEAADWLPLRSGVSRWVIMYYGVRALTM